MLAAYRNWRRVSQLSAPEAWVRRTYANLAVSAFRRRVSEAKALIRLGHVVDRPALSADDEALWSAPVGQGIGLLVAAAGFAGVSVALLRMSNDEFDLPAAAAPERTPAPATS
jgi:DNA-directed RNA polymerase specialized sigma24 family protein